MKQAVPKHNEDEAELVGGVTVLFVLQELKWQPCVVEDKDVE